MEKKKIKFAYYIHCKKTQEIYDFSIQASHICISGCVTKSMKVGK